MPILDSSQFLNSPIGEKFACVYLFLGDEETLVQSAFEFLLASYRECFGTTNQEFNIEKFQGEDDAVEKVIASCQTYPLFCPKKLVILTHLEKLNDSSLEQLYSYLKDPADFSILALLQYSRPDKNTLQKKLPQIVSATGILVKCWKPLEEKRLVWIQKRCATYGKKIENEALHFMSDEGGESLGELATEIEKVVLLIGKKPQIEVEDVQCALSFSGNYSVWNLLGALEKKDLKNSLEILENCLQQGEEPLKLLNLIARWCRKEVGNEFLFPEIKSADLMLKSGHGIESAVLERFLLQLCQKDK